MILSDTCRLLASDMVRVQQLHGQGPDTMAEQESILARQDQRWGELTDEEQDLINGLSADLYQLSDEEIGPTPPMPIQQVRDAYRSLLGTDDVAAKLDLLRHAGAHLPEPVLAALRGGLYGQLGFVDVSRAFTDFALMQMIERWDDEL